MRKQWIGQSTGYDGLIPENAYHLHVALEIAGLSLLAISSVNVLSKAQDWFQHMLSCWANNYIWKWCHISQRRIFCKYLHGTTRTILCDVFWIYHSMCPKGLWQQVIKISSSSLQVFHVPNGYRFSCFFWIFFPVINEFLIFFFFRHLQH